MKTRLAMILSIGGVLTAGSAAALVNTQALSGAAPAAPAPALVTAASQPLVVEVAPSTSTTAPGAGTDDGGKLGASGETIPGTTAPAVAADHVFDVGAAGVVTVRGAAGDALSLVSATPQPGWVVTSGGSTAFNQVQVVFRSATTEVTFVARLDHGSVTTSVGAVALPTAGTTASSVHSGSDDDSGHHSDDDSDHHEDDGGSDD